MARSSFKPGVVLFILLAAVSYVQASVGEPIIDTPSDPAAAVTSAVTGHGPTATAAAPDAAAAARDGAPAAAASAAAADAPPAEVQAAQQPTTSPSRVSESPKKVAASIASAWRKHSKLKHAECEMLVELDPTVVDSSSPDATTASAQAFFSGAQVQRSVQIPSATKALLNGLGVEVIRTPDGAAAEATTGTVPATSAAMVAAAAAGGVSAASASQEGTLVVATLRDCSAAKDKCLPRVARDLMKHPGVRYVEPNWIVAKQVTAANDEYYTSYRLWGMYSGNTTSGPSNKYGSGAAAAWLNGHTDCSSVYVGVVDEGVNVQHQDLAANVGNPKEICGNRKDDDGNGKVDDCYGWDFAGKDKTVYDGGNNYNIDSHGTHVAGTIGAVGDNNIGVAGICWKIRIISGKFLSPSGGTIANAVKAVDYMVTLKQKVGLKIVAINNSWGGGGYSKALSDAITRAGNAGILMVCAAGNDGVNADSAPMYPAAYPHDNIISVASINAFGDKSKFSNYGKTSVDIAAPGEGIYSTFPGNQYAQMAGTSMATPHVTGAAALWAAYHPTATAADIKAAILSKAAFTPSMDGKAISNGRLDVSAF